MWPTLAHLVSKLNYLGLDLGPMLSRYILGIVSCEYVDVLRHVHFSSLLALLVLVLCTVPYRHLKKIVSPAFFNWAFFPTSWKSTHWKLAYLRTVIVLRVFIYLEKVHTCWICLATIEARRSFRKICISLNAFHVSNMQAQYTMAQRSKTCTDVHA